MKHVYNAIPKSNYGNRKKPSVLADTSMKNDVIECKCT